MSQAPFMPLATDAYLADTTHLTTEEHGAYLLILLATWRNNGEPLPDDDIRLSRVIRCTVKRWKTKLRPVIIEFFDVSDGHLRQKRLEKVWIDVSKNIQQKSIAGKASALKRKKTIPTAVLRGCNGKTTNHNHNHNHSKKENITKEKLGFEEFWKTVPRKAGRKAAKKSFVVALKKADLQIILEGMKRYADETSGRELEYIKHPATWLNQECWDDEPGSNHAATPGVQKGTNPVSGKSSSPSFNRAADEVLSQFQSRSNGLSGEGLHGDGGQDESGEIIEGEFTAGEPGTVIDGIEETGGENGAEEGGSSGSTTENNGLSGGTDTDSTGHGAACSEGVAQDNGGQVVSGVG